VWTTDTQANIVGGSATYTVDGDQYVAVVASGPCGFGGGGGYWAPTYSRLLVYKLGGKAVLPQMVPYTPPPLSPPEEFGTPEQLAKGEALYDANCNSCHANGGRVSSLFPDLRYAGPIHGAEAFKAIVIDGALEQNGMVSFRKVLKPDDAEAIRAYVVHLANDLKKNPPPAFGFGAPGAGRGAAGGAPGAGGASQPSSTPPTTAPHQ
jgi:quinohemoprotein ethanol dehydrogenase